MKRYIILNRPTGIYSGMIYDRTWSEIRLADMRKTWPGVEREIEQTPEQFPVPGLIHIGEVRAKRILERHMSDVQPAEKHHDR